MITGADLGGKVANLDDVEVFEREPDELRHVEPLVRRALQAAVVEVKAVDIDVGDIAPRQS